MTLSKVNFYVRHSPMMQPSCLRALIAELQKTWNRKHAAAWAELYGAVSPNYGAVVESFNSKPDNSDSK